MTKVRIIALGALWTTSVAGAAEQDCEPSKWGMGDEIGSANLITAESVLAASKLIKTGKTYSLGVTIDSATPAFPPRGLALQVVQPGQQQGRAAFPNMAYNDDLVQTWLGIGSQIDGLGHLGAPGGVYYNCNRAEDFAEITGLTKLGIDKIPPIVARGVVLDMAGHAGVEVMRAGQFFTTADVQAVEEKQGTPIREGDVVLFHTGWTEECWHQTPTPGLPGNRVWPKRWPTTWQAGTSSRQARIPGDSMSCRRSIPNGRSRATSPCSRRTASTFWRS